MRGLRVPKEVPDVGVSVVSGADPSLLRGFLSSLSTGLSQSPLSRRVVAFRNTASAPPAAELLQLGANEVIERSSPAGFAANHNEAIRRFPARYHLIANDDVLIKDDAVTRLVGFLDRLEQARVGVVSPRLLNFDGSLQPSTYSFPTVPRAVLGMSGLRERVGTGRLVRALARVIAPSPGASRLWAHDHQADVDTMKGAFTLVRRRCIDEVGLMDEVSLVGGEETEWHRRMHDAGWRVVFWPEVSVLHKGSATVGGQRGLESEYLKGMLNYFAKHCSAPAYLSVRALGAGVYGARWLSSAVRGDADGRNISGRCLLRVLRGMRDLAGRPA
jgi:GT2 family glycosyltransferase